jgi:dTMP kinase
MAEGSVAGRFITIEGPDGAGKTTQAARLAAALEAAGVAVELVREPGGTELGERLRALLLHGSDLTIVPSTDALLFNAARAELVAEVIAPALDAGHTVVCARYTDSTLAYQGYGAGLELPALRRLADFATGGLAPHLTILLDVPADVGLTRKRRGPSDRLTRFEEHSDLDFHERVRSGFHALAEAEPARWRVIDATRPSKVVAAAVADTVRSFFADAPRDEPNAVLGRISR